jgi:hypothetical protein
LSHKAVHNWIANVSVITEIRKWLRQHSKYFYAAGFIELVKRWNKCIATVLDVCTTEEQRPIVRFLWAKGLNAKDINKETYPVYVGKCLWLETEAFK